ncbi:MAG: MBL fold metallo-hydrolase [Candidatus Ratteibacteria bacterium]
MNDKIKDFEGIYRVGWYGIKEMTSYLAHCNVYGFEYKNGFILIDCGNGFTGREIYENVKKITSKKITHIFLTHCHYDHSLNSLFFKEKEAEIICHKNCAKSFQEKTYRVWYEFPHLVKPFKIEKTFISDKKFIFDEFELFCLYTPGHTMGCSSYLLNLNKKKFLFTGDLIMPEGEIGWSGSEDFNKDQLLKSLEKIERVDFDFLLPGHGNHYNKKVGKENIKIAIEKGKMGKWKIQKDYHY